MTIIDCAPAKVPIPRGAMKGTPLQIRAKRAGLTQKRLANILGVTEATASNQLSGTWESGTPRYVVAAIIAWELLDHDKRMRWIDELDAEVAELKRPAK